MPGGGVYSEPRNAVMPTVGHVEEFPRSREVYLGAGVPRGVPVGQGRDRLYRRQGAGRIVQMIGSDAAALLVGKIDEIQGGMKTIVAGPRRSFGSTRNGELAVRRPV